MEDIPDEAQNTTEPVTMQFNPSVPSSQLSWYQSQYPDYAVTFYKTMHYNKYLWWSVVPPYDATIDQDDYQRMRENNTSYYSGGTHYIPGYRHNLAYGSVNANDNQGWSYADNNGTTYIWRGTAQGLWAEWRYLGYTKFGDPISNPYFPPDVPSSTENAYTHYDDFDTHQDPTNYDNDRITKSGWVDKYLFDAVLDGNGNFVLDGSGNKQYRDSLHFREVNSNPDFWVDKLSLYTDPSKSAGVWKGYHGAFYRTTVTQCPPQPNIRIMDFTIKDKQTGELVGTFQRSYEPYNWDPITKTADRSVYVQKGQQLSISVTYHNMTPPEHWTVVNQQKVKTVVAWGQDYWAHNVYDDQFETNGESKVLGPGGDTTFTYDYTVPTTAKGEIYLKTEVPMSYYNCGDDVFVSDSVAELDFLIAPEDMSLTSVRIVDENGDDVSDGKVIPGDSYKAIYTIKKNSGEKIVQDIHVNGSFNDIYKF